MRKEEVRVIAKAIVSRLQSKQQRLRWGPTTSFMELTFNVAMRMIARKTLLWKRSGG
ncbi:hypothetical protein OIU79_013785 [Salix purpurea]|uniref:Uncharacterized protein n=1 Tax=Salix purpurea TaxID=77065 RepID=A0A9Q0PPA2_SALPP|nr:hypothetical protein OIU79_013785 [Salix purpurea]